MTDMLFGVVLVLSFLVYIDGCQDDWIGHGDSCYLFIGTKEPWAQAGQICAAHGAALVAIENEEENRFIRGYLKVYAGGCNKHYTSLSLTTIKLKLCKDDNSNSQSICWRFRCELGADMTIWIGGTDMDIEGIWKWLSSGERITYTDWYPGEPNGNADCLSIWNKLDYHWDDRDCTDGVSFMCEKSKNSEPVIG